MKDITSDKFASVIARILDDKQGKDIKILNISNISVLADYFERIPIGEENDVKNRWNLLDYGDVIVHVLHKEERETYAIERFWNHAFCVEEDEWMKKSEEYSDYNK